MSKLTPKTTREQLLDIYNKIDLIQNNHLKHLEKHRKRVLNNSTYVAQFIYEDFGSVNSEEIKDTVPDGAIEISKVSNCFEHLYHLFSLKCNIANTNTKKTTYGSYTIKTSLQETIK